MQPCSPDYKSGFSSFHYVCSAIHPEVKIAISGSLISNEDNLYDRLKTDTQLQKKIIERIQSHAGEEFMIATYTVRELLDETQRENQRAK